MRISTNLMFATGQNTINNQQSDLMHLFQQIGSGQRMVSPADDPLGAAQAINISQSQSMNQRYAENRAVATRNLGVEENALTSLTNLLADVRTRVVEAGNGTLSDADRSTLSDVLKQTKQTMLGIANTTDGNGQYLFSGSKGQTAAYQLNPVTNQYEYAGDAAQRDIQVDQTRRIAGSDIGTDIFNRAQPGTRAYMSAVGPLNTNTGAGVIGNPAVADSALANPNYGFAVEFTSETSYEVTVTDLSTGTAVGTPTTHTLVPDSGVLELGYGMQAQFSGVPAAGDTFEVQPLAQTDVNLFDTIDGLIAALHTPISGDPAAQATLRNVLNTSIQRFATSYDNVLTVRASVGTRMNEITALDTSGVQRNLGYATALSGLEDLDYYEATMQLNLRKMALEGASLAFQTIQGLSLFQMNGGR
ncbi:MAG: flagellar hook-associated protein FlgL [Alcaligenaceae bacterium]|nr:flagellar hook-associated protein FlgL [Alcaligenaceae bacterium]